MSGKDAGGGVHIGQKTLVASQQAAFEEWRGEAHGEGLPQPAPLSHRKPLIVKKERAVAVMRAAAQMPSLPYFWPRMG